MIRLGLMCASLFAALPTGRDAVTPDVREAYREARGRAGRDPGKNVDLALWCEAHGLEAERARHLGLALLADPENVKARALLGRVSYGGRWRSPEQVDEEVRADADLAARMAEYNRRRQALEEYARGYFGYDSVRNAAVGRAHMRLAVWCEEHDLKPEAVAHFTQASRLNPSLKTPWEHLGCRKHRGRWMTAEQIAAEQEEATAQRHADRTWEPLLARWKLLLGKNEVGRREAEAKLAGVTDPRAVPSIWKVFVTHGGTDDHRRAVGLLTQIDGGAASMALLRLALLDARDGTRRKATDALKVRDTREVIPTLIGLIRDPVTYELQPNGDVGALVVEGKDFLIRRDYRALRPVSDFSWLGFSDNINRRAIVSQIEANEQAALRARARYQADVAELEGYNRAAVERSAPILTILWELTRQDYGPDSVAWTQWWAEQQGYAYDPPDPEKKRTYYRPFSALPHTSCFGAGTPVRTLTGPRPIETIRVGDRVLAQDVATGELGYQPVVAVYHNPPSPTLRLTLDDDEVVVTGIHRIWKAGQGWVMARDLRPGDPVRTVGGVARVVAVERREAEPVFNLDVARSRDFFVGRSGALAHDNTLVEPTPAPFDAVPPALAQAPVGSSIQRP